MSVEAVRAALAEHEDLVRRVATGLASAIDELAGVVAETLGAGGKVLFCGNGGSAADAQHLAAEYVVKLAGERQPLPAIALTTDGSILTAASNDYGFENVFVRQLRALGRPGDLLVVHSTSGSSANLLAAADAARERGMKVAAVLAKGGGALRDRVDLALVVPTDSPERAQELHITIGHVVCALVERTLGSGGPRGTLGADGAAGCPS